MSEVAKKLGISIDAVVYMMRKNNLPRRNLRDANIALFNSKKASFSRRKIKSIKGRELKVAGAMLYWAEGYKSDKSSGVDFANSDVEMVAVFMKFMRSVYKLDESRFRILLYCYSNQDVNLLKQYWSKVTRIPLNQFSKPYVRKDFRKNGRIMKHGMVHIRYSDKKLLIDLKRILREYKSRLVNAPIA